MRLEGVPSQRIKSVWDDVLPFIRRALKYGDGRVLEDDILDSLTAGDYQLWRARDESTRGVMITEIAQYPRCKTVNIVLLGGDAWNEMKHLETNLVAWARVMGCEAIEIAHARPGWERLLPDWAKTAVVLERGV